MKTKNLIGLDSENAQQVVNLLNELLANYQIYYQNLRGFHWNVRGNRFFVLHAIKKMLLTEMLVCGLL